MTRHHRTTFVSTMKLFYTLWTKQSEQHLTILHVIMITIIIAAVVQMPMLIVLSSITQEFTRFMWRMQSQCQVATNRQTKPTNLDWSILLSTATVAIY